MASAPHVLFAGGGSAGHLFPGMAVSEHLRKKLPEIQVTFAGSGAARERHAVQQAGHRYTMIPAQGKPRNPLQAIRFVADNVAGYCAARWMLREQRVSIVVCVGGSTSMAVVRAAFARGIPVVLLEQNAIPGRATRWMSRAAAMVCAAFEEVRPYLQTQAPITVTGNPSRAAFEHLYFQLHGGNSTQQKSGASSARTNESSPAPAQPLPLTASQPRRQRRLVILGGSSGAKSLNESVPAALKQLGGRLEGWQIVHQTGDGQLHDTENRYVQAGVKALPVAHIDHVASVLFASDLVVCRAGGTQLAELALAGLPGVLIPFPQSSDNHQAANAKAIAAASACRVIDETKERGALDAALIRELEPLVSDHHLRAEMARNMHRQARPQAAAQIASAVIDLLGGGAGLAAA